MTKKQQEFIDKNADKITSYYEANGGVRVTQKHGTKYFIQFYVGPRGGTSYQKALIFRFVDEKGVPYGFIKSTMI